MKIKLSSKTFDTLLIASLLVFVFTFCAAVMLSTLVSSDITFVLFDVSLIALLIAIILLYFA